MKPIIIITALLWVLTTVAFGQDRDLTGYTLVFSDEFDARSIGDHRDKGSNTWGDYPPYGAAAAFSFSHWMGSFQGRTDFATVDGGILSLWTRRVELNDSNGRNWVSGVIASKDVRNSGFAQRFGYWSARVRMPDARNSAWCAFWLASTSGIPSAGSKGYEIDILEWYGRGSRTVVDHVAHPWNADGSQAPPPFEGGITVPIPGGTFNEFHVYGCEVNPTNVIFYIDGVETFRRDTHLDYVNDPLYIILNYALQGGPDPDFPLDSAFEVDWVRAYSLPASVPIPPVPVVEVGNPGFEDNPAGSQEASGGWGEWSPVNANPNGFVAAGGHSGVNSYRMEGENFSLFLSQVIQVRETGLYTFRAWTRSSGGNASLVIQQYQGGDQRSQDIPASATWQQVEIRDINIEGSSIRIGLWMSTDINHWVEWDDVEFIQQGGTTPTPPAPPSNLRVQ